MFLIIIGAINWGFEAFDYNLVEKLSGSINKLFNVNYPINKIIYILVAVAGIALALKEHTWLPFLGHTVLPETVLDLKIPDNYDTKVKIMTKPNSKIIYWAAIGKDNLNQDVDIAYADYKNCGVVLSDSEGYAELYILEGGGYTTPFGLKLRRHIHYRIAESNAFLGEVKTVYY
jgi:uncharacterized membrane protein YuzA (DUF378 family)